MKNKIFTEGLSKVILENKVGKITPIIFNWNFNDGVALMNPSIYNDQGNLICIVRCTNYTLHHSEKNKYPHWAGPLQYIHPENDVRLATENFLVTLDPETNLVTSSNKVEMTFNKEPIWSFHGLEDARLVRWNGDLYMCGVRRDTTEDGQGRMELSKIEISEDGKVREVSRERIPAPGNDDSYCEKNWMPVIDEPFTYVKWTNPTEMIRYNIEDKTVFNWFPNHNIVPGSKNIRGNSHLVSYGDYYIALGHSVSLWKPYSGEKDSEYLTHVMVWDKGFNLIKVTEGFHMLDSKIEFGCGMCIGPKGDILISFAEMDNAAYILSVCPDWFFNTVIEDL